MATILVDYENVSTTDGLKGVEHIDMIEKSQCKFKTYKLAKTGKNALDFYIAVACGIKCTRGRGPKEANKREDGRAIYQVLKQVV